MKLSLSWLKNYLDLSLPAPELAEKLTLAGLEAEGFEQIGNDTVFSIGLTPNLGHCLSVRGIARELSAILDIPLKKIDFPLDEVEKQTSDLVAISIEDKDCFRYGCRLVENITVGPSPAWLVQHLENAGIRSINNVVDIGNYVMLAWGQPLHLFDFGKIKGKTLTIRKQQGPAAITTLDETLRDIPEGALLIADQEGPIAIAGVMGDQTTAVSDETQTVLIEAALFSPEAVRSSCKQLNLRSESSNRFERGVDPLAVFAALDYAASLLQTVAGGNALKGVVSSVKTEFATTVVEIDPLQVNRLLGTNLSFGEMATLLSRLDFHILSQSSHNLRVEVPSFRNDVKAPIDLVEEVGRLFGFNHIPRPIPRHASSTMTHSPLYLFERKARNQMAAMGLQEWLTCDLISPRLSQLGSENALRKDTIAVLHPASVDQSILRTTLLPGMLEVVKANIDRQQTNLAAFEVGHIHFKENDTYHSEPVVGILLTGKEVPYHFATKPREVDFFHLKGIVENFLHSLHLAIGELSPSHYHNFHPKQQASVKIQDQVIGSFGQVHPQHLRELGIEQKVFYAECDLGDLLRLYPETVSFSPLPQYPGSERDWTISLPNAVSIATVLGGISQLNSPLLENCFLLDLYQGEKVDKGNKNATFRFQYRDLKKTISLDEVEKEHSRLTESMAQKLAVM